jgi:hypothetical protein
MFTTARIKTYHSAMALFALVPWAKGQLNGTTGFFS